MSPTKKPASRKKPGSKRPAPADAKSGRGRKRPLTGKKRPPKATKPARRPAKKTAGGPAAAPAENPRAKALARRIADLLLEKKAGDVVILDVRGKTSYADYMVVASGESDRQVTAMAEHVTVTLKQQDDLRVVGSEGQETGNWVLLDFGEVIAHLFFTEVRAFYDLEGLWADAPREKVA